MGIHCHAYLQGSCNSVMVAPREMQLSRKPLLRLRIKVSNFSAIIFGMGYVTVLLGTS